MSNFLWEIWSEGYSDDKGGVKAKYHAMIPADTFQEAIELYYESQSKAQQFVIDTVAGTYYGRKFHDSEEKAREIYG